MNLEVIDFFPLKNDEKKDFLSGTLRVRLSDIGIDILGIYVTRKKGFWMFSLPNRLATHHETGFPVVYPCISFVDREKQNELISVVRAKGLVFIEAKLAEGLKFPPLKERRDEEALVGKVENKAETVKETSIVKPEGKVSTAPRVFVDPPPRKFPAKPKKVYR